MNGLIPYQEDPDANRIEEGSEPGLTGIDGGLDLTERGGGADPHPRTPTVKAPSAPELKLGWRRSPEYRVQRASAQGFRDKQDDIRIDTGSESVERGQNRASLEGPE